MISVCNDLFGETFEMGHAAEDMVAVIETLERRSAALAGDLGENPSSRS